jgi:hypothetical protein
LLLFEKLFGPVIPVTGQSRTWPHPDRVLEADCPPERKQESVMTRSIIGFALAVAILSGFATSASAKPSWTAPGSCFTDDGQNRYRSCSASDG